jgi:hypothetical protein
MDMVSPDKTKGTGVGASGNAHRKRQRVMPWALKGGKVGPPEVVVLIESENKRNGTLPNHE